MDMVRSPKSISGAVALALGNAPYQIGDRTKNAREHKCLNPEAEPANGEVQPPQSGFDFYR